NQAPWATLKTDQARAAVATRTALNLLPICASVAWSIIPGLTSSVLAAFGEADDYPAWPKGSPNALLDGRKGLSTAKIKPLVAKFAEAQISEFERRFGGTDF